MEDSVILISSLTVNFCFLFVLVVSWLLRRRREGRGGGSKGHVEVECLEDGDKESNEHELGLQKPAKQDAHKISTESMDAYVLSDIVMSTFCLGAGLYIITSSSLWQCPFTCPVATPSGAVTPSPYQSPFGRVPSALLSAAFGRFIFSFSHLIYTGCKSGQWSLWSVVHSGYLCINVIVIGVILTTGENLLGAALVLLMEADVAIEQICQVIDKRAADKNLRKARVLLSVLGCAMSFGTRVAMPWVMSLALGHVYNPIGMSVHSLGVASFGFIFYQAYTLLAMKQQCERIQRVIGEGDCLAVNDAVESYHGNSRCFIHRGSGSKDMAFHLINEGLIEISSYAKTVAGVITGKKLVPVEGLRDNFLPVKSQSKSVKHTNAS